MFFLSRRTCMHAHGILINHQIQEPWLFPIPFYSVAARARGRPGIETLKYGFNLPPIRVADPDVKIDRIQIRFSPKKHHPID